VNWPSIWLAYCFANAEIFITGGGLGN